MLHGADDGKDRVLVEWALSRKMMSSEYIGDEMERSI